MPTTTPHSAWLTSGRQQSMRRLSASMRSGGMETVSRALETVATTLGTMDTQETALLLYVRQRDTGALLSCRDRSDPPVPSVFLVGRHRIDVGAISEERSYAFSGGAAAAGGAVLVFDIWQEADGTIEMMTRRYVGHVLDGRTRRTPAAARISGGRCRTTSVQAGRRHDGCPGTFLPAFCRSLTAS